MHVSYTSLGRTREGVRMLEEQERRRAEAVQGNAVLIQHKPATRVFCLISESRRCSVLHSLHLTTCCCASVGPSPEVTSGDALTRGEEAYLGVSCYAPTRSRD
eukprot:2455184-Rhodomonas_salina.2